MIELIALTQGYQLKDLGYQISKIILFKYFNLIKTVIYNVFDS